MKKYIYPRLPAIKDLWLFRLGGNGLANCLFVYAKAIIKAQQNNQLIITPTWVNLSIGTYLRRQIDKRHYLKIFKSEISVMKKLILLIFKNKHVEAVDGISDYFTPLKGHNQAIKEYLINQLNPGLKKELPQIINDVIALHIRLGDYPSERRIPIVWYTKIVNELKKITNDKYFFYVYSDGTEEELKEILCIDGVTRKSYNNAFLDMWAISQSKIIIASDSTFSAWGAYLNQVPVIFHKRHFPSVLDNKRNEIVIGDDIEQLLPWFNQLFKQ